MRHSDPVPLSFIGGDDDDLLEALQPRSGRNLAYLREETRLGAPFAGGQLAVLARQSVTIVSTAGAVELARDVSTSGNPPTDRHYDVNFRYAGFAGAGLAWRTGDAPSQDLSDPWGFGAAGHRPGLHWQLGVQALALKRLSWWRGSGEAAFDAATGEYSADLVSDRANDHLDFPFQRDYASYGFGLLLDGQAMHCGQSLCLGAGVKDLGRLLWRDLPREVATLSTSTQSVDEDGFLIYKPLVEGHYSQENASLAAPATLNLDLRWQLAPSWRANARADWLMDFGWLPSAGVAWTGFGGLEWGLAWHIRERRLTAQLGSKYWLLRFGADEFGSQARSREFAVAVNWPLD